MVLLVYILTGKFSLSGIEQISCPLNMEGVSQRTAADQDILLFCISLQFVKSFLKAHVSFSPKALIQLSQKILVEQKQFSFHAAEGFLVFLTWWKCRGFDEVGVDYVSFTFPIEQQNHVNLQFYPIHFIRLKCNFYLFPQAVPVCLFYCTSCNQANRT